MKKYIFAGVFFCTTVLHAGFFGSMIGGAIGAELGSSGGTQQRAVPQTRFDKVNTYLWNMHESGKYSKDYMFYLKYLEQADEINHLDTVAWVYKDNGNKKKAIQIYKTRILSWVKIEDEKTQEKYKQYFQQISDQVVSTPKVKKVEKITPRQRCESKGKKWIWKSNINKWMCVK